MLCICCSVTVGEQTKVACRGVLCSLTMLRLPGWQKKLNHVVTIHVRHRKVAGHSARSPDDVEGSCLPPFVQRSAQWQREVFLVKMKRVTLDNVSSNQE